MGFHYLGPNAGEVTQGFGIALQMGATKANFDRLIGIHPTCAEVTLAYLQRKLVSARTEHLYRCCRKGAASRRLTIGLPLAIFPSLSAHMTLCTHTYARTHTLSASPQEPHKCPLSSSHRPERFVITLCRRS